jgi:hypothetical protein
VAEGAALIASSHRSLQCNKPVGVSSNKPHGRFFLKWMSLAPKKGHQPLPAKDRIVQQQANELTGPLILP